MINDKRYADDTIFVSGTLENLKMSTEKLEMSYSKLDININPQKLQDNLSR